MSRANQAAKPPQHESAIMKYRIGILALAVTLLSPASADLASESLLRDRIAALNEDPEWQASASAVRSEGEDTVAEGLALALSAPRANITAAEFRIENLTPGEDEQFSFTGGALNDLRLASPLLKLLVPGTEAGQPDENLSIASLEIGGIEFLDEKGMSSATARIDPDADRETRDAAMLEALNAMPRVGHFAVSELVLGNAKPLRMETLRVDVEDYLGPIPLPWRAEMTNLALPGLYLRSALKHVEPRAAQILRPLDDAIFTVNASGGEIWVDAETGEVRASARITINDGAVLDLTYNYVGVSEAWLASVTGEALYGDLRQAIADFESGVKLKSLTLRISDRTLLNDIFGAVAEELRLGVDGAAYRQQISSFALPLFMLALGRPDMLDVFLPPLQEFLGAGKPLLVQAQPAEPVSAAAIADAFNRDPETLMALLNLTITTDDSAALR
jgi:hypothetical protein